MSKHTPGPGMLHVFVHHDNSVTETDALHADVSYVREDIFDDLLAALKFARPFMAMANLESSQDLISDIDAAIAKAKGESE